MRSKFIIPLLAAILGIACSPDSLPEYDFSNYTIDRVVCEASSNYLVADNVSELDLNIKIYTKIAQYTDIYGVVRDRYMEIPRARWRRHDVKFWVNGTQVTPPYKTSATQPSLLQCYAEVDGVRSGQSPAKLYTLYPPMEEDGQPEGAAPDYPDDPDPFFFEVTVRAPYTPAARKIPIVFHVIDTKANYDKGQHLRSGAIHDLVGLLNDVYGRRHDTAPNGANPNLEFVLALRDPSGAPMGDPGINRITLDADEAEDYNANNELWIWNLDKTDDGLEMDKKRYQSLVAEGKLPVRTPRAFWDPDRYLNVWIYYTPDDMGVPFSSLTSTYFPFVYPEGVYDPQALPIPESWNSRLRIMDSEQMAMWKKNPADLRLPPSAFADKYTGLGQAGLKLKKSTVANYGVNVTQQVGAFFGLIPSAAVDMGSSDDYCDDTPRFIRWYDSSFASAIEGDGSDRVKYTVDPPYYVYRAANVMESGSAMSYISQDQVRRMEWALENIPGRQMWRDLSAIEK